MRIVKVLNNNVVIVQDYAQQEKVVMGKGLGFQVKVGSEVDADRIEKVFALEQAEHAASAAPEGVDSIPPELYQVCAQLVAQAGRRLHLSFHNSLTMALADHIYYALQRLIRGEHVVNALLQEIRQFYPEEYALGEDALKLIREQTGLNLPEDEAGFIALHLVNAALDENMPKTLEVTRLIADIIAIVNTQLGIKPQEHNLDYTRFVTHLKFFAHRLLRQEELPPSADFLFDEVKKHYLVAYSCVQRIGLYVKKKFGHDLGRDEITFLTVHIERVRHATQGH